jgi:hypothetical protein
MGHENVNTELTETSERDPFKETDEGQLFDLDASAPVGDITLESILAEYKGSAFIAGEKRTPSEILQKKTEKIVMETTGRLDLPAADELLFTPEEAEKTKPLPSLEEIRTSSTKPLPSLDNIKPAAAYRGANSESFTEVTDRKRPDKTALPREEIVSFDQLTRTPSRSAEHPSERSKPPLADIAREVEQAIEEQSRLEETTEKSVRKAFGLFSRRAPKDEYDEYDDDEMGEDDAPPVPVIEEEIIEEPDYRTAVRKFAEKCNIYSLKSFISLVLTIVMAILTVIYQSGSSMPFGFTDNGLVNTGVLMILLCVVMLFSVDHLTNGIIDLVKGKSGIDALNLFSCLTAIASGAFSIITKDTDIGVPFCVVSAASLTFTLWGEKIYYRAMTETMKTALSVGVPYGVIAEYSRELDKTVIKKVSDRTEGFYNNLIQADISETAFRYAAPILIVSSAVLGLYSSLGVGQGRYFLHNFAAIMAAAAPFSAIFAYAIPLSAVNRRARQSGAAVAGWGGADDLNHSDGASVTDEDLFPQGNVTLGGIKIFEEVLPDKALRYTASLIIASGSGLSKLFSELLSKQGMNLVHVEDFTCYEGGIGGTVKGERVYTGSAAFMNLQGIRIPASLNNKSSIFTAANKKLIAVFTINYVPVKTVQNALLSILRYRVKLFFAIRDFNITPVMLEQKFKIPVDNVEYIPIKESYDISDDAKQEAKRVSAVLTREGMGPYVEAITGGRRLKTTALIATVFSIISAVGGMLIMFAICWTGAFSAASPGNLLLYMLSMLFIILIICGFSKYRQ